MQKFFKLVGALGLLLINAIVAHPMESGGTETISQNVSTRSVECLGVPKRYYEELNCTAVYKNPQDHCPSRYTCDTFEQSDVEMCYFAGESLLPGSVLNDTGNPCDIGCSCELEGPYLDYNVSKMAVFRCAVVDCPLEEESAWDENGEMRKCVPKKSHDECCASETVCIDDVEGDERNSTDQSRESKNIGENKTDEKLPKKLATCITADNVTYIEGQEFYPEDLPCKVCICQPGYKAGESGEPWCRDVQCGTLIAHTRQIREGCSPVYFNTNRCCPIDFHCPNEADSVVTDVLLKNEPNPDETCKFGRLSFRVGDRLSSRPDAKCIKCECEIPPYLTCSSNPDC